MVFVAKARTANQLRKELVAYYAQRARWVEESAKTLEAAKKRDPRKTPQYTVDAAWDRYHALNEVAQFLENLHIEPARTRRIKPKDLPHD
jgi:hypothetical protein